LPEDRFVTTYVFGSQDGGVPTDTDLDGIAARLQSFWTDDVVGGSGTLSALLGGQVNNASQIRLYRLNDDPPREPTVYDFTLTGTAATGMPAEVALCISYFATRNIAGRRGRIYIGPLSSSVGSFIGADWRPTTATRDTLAGKATDLLAAADLAGWPWALLSSDGVARPITDGWVDDAFDTQRRRGLDPTDRTLWP